MPPPPSSMALPSEFLSRADYRWFARLPVYRGSNSRLHYEDWEAEIEDFIIKCKLNQKEAYLCARCKLGGEAALWWQVHGKGFQYWFHLNDELQQQFLYKPRSKPKADFQTEISDIKHSLQEIQQVFLQHLQRFKEQEESKAKLEANFAPEVPMQAEPEIVVKPDTVMETLIDSVAEPEPESDLEPKVGVPPEPPVQPTPEPELDLKAKRESKTAPDLAIELGLESPIDQDLSHEPDPETPHEQDSSADLDPKVEDTPSTELDTDPEQDFKIETKSDSESERNGHEELKIQTMSEPELESKFETEHKTQIEPDVQSEPDDQRQLSVLPALENQINTSLELVEHIEFIIPDPPQLTSQQLLQAYLCLSKLRLPEKVHLHTYCLLHFKIRGRVFSNKKSLMFDPDTVIFINIHQVVNFSKWRRMMGTALVYIVP